MRLDAVQRLPSVAWARCYFANLARPIVVKDNETGELDCARIVWPPNSFGQTDDRWMDNLDIPNPTHDVGPIATTGFAFQIVGNRVPFTSRVSDCTGVVDNLPRRVSRTNSNNSISRHGLSLLR